MFFRVFFFLIFILTFQESVFGQTDDLPDGSTEEESKALIIDHNCTDISRIPKAYIKKAQKSLGVSFSHSAEDIQIIAGLESIQNLDSNLYKFFDDSNFYKTADINFKLPSGALSLWGGLPKGNLGFPNRTSWTDRTEVFLKGFGSTRDIVIWSWGKYASTATEDDIYSYLGEMDDLESKFPEVKFVYMTGALDGTGKDGNLNKNNEMIRKFCRENNKILFDFADIESYDPEGEVNYMELNGDANCNYIQNGKKKNWADSWLGKNPGNSIMLPQGGCGTKPLNAALKARAFWWMLACLAGWEPPEKTAAGVTGFSLGTTSETPFTKSLPAAPDEIKNPLAVKKGFRFSKTYKFNRLRDYRDWVELGTFDSIIPKKGRGLSIPKTANLALGVNRKLLNIREMQFKAKILSGKSLNWYINFEWDGSWKPLKGIGGIINENGCELTVDGELIEIKNSPKSNSQEHHHMILLKNRKLLWIMDGEKIIEREISEKAALRRGLVGVGSLNSKVRIDGIFLKE